MAHVVAPEASPAEVWAALAPLLTPAGRHKVRLRDPETGKFSDTGRLTKSVPTRPAAVYLYSRGVTRWLGLDFDVKRGGTAAVERDAAMAIRWLTAAGGRIITDRSTNGGRHIICPLAIGTTATLTEIVALARTLAAHLPTLDITPNTNARTGCLTLPGSPCKEGGYRQLLGSVAEARDALTVGSDPDFLPNIYVALGLLKPAPSATAPTPDPVDTCPPPSEFTTGTGDDLRIAPEYANPSPLPPAVAHYATHGDPTGAAARRWDSHSEARMTVLYHAVSRGYTLNQLRELIAPGQPWHPGLGAAFDRYYHRADIALSRDFTKALDYYIQNVVIHRHRQHKKKNTPRGGAVQASPTGPAGPPDLRRWLAYAFRWADTEYRGKRQRWTVRVVLQALAYLAMKSGEQVNGVWVVAVGGRSLSLAAGLLTSDAVWKVLRDVRERVGAPLILTRQAVGCDADAYALTFQGAQPADIGAAERIRIEPVHDAWQILGWHLQRIHDLVVHHGLTDRADIYAAASVPRSTGDEMVRDLHIRGLITITGRGRVAPGTATVNTVAERHNLHESRQERIEKYRSERAAWQGWLDRRNEEHVVLAQTEDEAYQRGPTRLRSLAVHAAYMRSVMSTGPPGEPGHEPPPDVEDDVTERRALALLWEVLGAVIAPQPLLR